MKVPVYFIRYEDLTTKPQKFLEEIFAFLLGESSLEGKLIQKRIQSAVSSIDKPTVVTDCSSDLLNQNAGRFSGEQVSWIKEVAGANLFYFGYTNTDSNPYSYFTFTNPL